MSVIERLKDEQKAAMRAKDKARLGTIRLALAAVKQQEVDGQKTLTDDEITAVLTKMVKQRRDSISQFEAAGRQDLADVEAAEVVVLQEFLPQPLTEEELGALVDKALADSGASSMQDMGKVMGLLKPQVQGRADMGAVSGLIKARLS
ncbi:MULTISPECIES: GatB/YqeY domain-containing protein [unclassified Ferrimonas]|uniref:GatB/YqeY domain-containing protein n=1 Tax=unclassified Ferrimonas TaxID=2620587 RepID=UPI0025733B97|nr:GatB/YqeY domain-containing protein [Ferrimonas sp. YFM]BDY06500.1 aspartyl-tRNA amidotransferase subunit B [Ferrimonas sp. YFM]